MVLVGFLAGCAAPPPGPAPAAPEPEDSQPSAIRAAIEKLRSESVEEREEASRRIRAAGLPAAPALRAAAEDPDPEVRARVRALLEELEEAKEAPNVVRIALDGSVVHEGRTVVGPDDPAADRKLEAFFEGRREIRRREEGRATTEGVGYPVLIQAARSTPFALVQRVMMAAARHGAVVRVRLAGD